MYKGPIIRIKLKKRKWSLSLPYLPCRAWTPRNTDKDRLPHLECIVINTDTNQESVLPIILKLRL